jgi:PhoH-like ATPase
LRIKAQSLGIPSEDYKTDKVSNMDIFSGEEEITNIDPDFISKMYQTKTPVSANNIPFTIPNENKNFILTSQDDEDKIYTYFELESKMLYPVNKINAYGIESRNAEQRFALHTLLNPRIPLVSITGRAGTGKTLLALAAALEQANEFDQILLARPIVPLSNRDIGFLPGNTQEKIGPYMLPLFDNLNVIKSANKKFSKQSDKIDQMLKSEQLLITPLAYIRGRSLSNVFFIIDEAQNLTPHEIKTIITRAGEGTKIVLSGDVEQIDAPYLDAQSNGLTYLTAKMRKQSVFMHVHLTKGERSKLSEIAGNLL